MDWSHLLAVGVGALLRPVFWPLKIYMWDKLWPSLVDHNSRHATIIGKWRVAHIGEPTDGDTLQAEWVLGVTLTQLGSVVKGSAVATCTSGKSKEHIVNYDVLGNFASGVLDIKFQDVDRSGRNRSTFLLQMVGDGSTLEGHRLFLGRKKNDIRSIPCKWVRNDTIPSGCGTA